MHSLPDTDLHVSTFCCGLGELFALPEKQSDAVLDAFVEAGGNFFDTAHVYSAWLPGGNGLSEIRIGDYVRRRGLKNVVVATKGGHPSLRHYRTVDHHLSAARIGADIEDSLARLECDSLALYYLHRDDLRLPVGEIMETLNAEIARGRLRHLGASNWSVERLADANEYARAHHLQGFVISQPRWSLAAHNNEDGLDTPGLSAWHRQSRLPLAPYSPTARGYFAAPVVPTQGGYASDENQLRRARVTELAKKLGATPNQIALAWLLNHPYPVFPILGTKNTGHLKEAFGAAAISLTGEELAWLSGEESASHQTK